MIEFLRENGKEVIGLISVIAACVLMFSLHSWFKALESWHKHLSEWSAFMTKHGKLPANDFKEVSEFLGGLNDTRKISHNSSQRDP